MISWAWTWSASLADNWDWLTQRAPSEQERRTGSWRKQKTKQIQKTNIVDKTELTATDALPSIFLSSFILIYDLTWEKSQWENTFHAKKQIKKKQREAQTKCLNKLLVKKRPKEEGDNVSFCFCHHQKHLEGGFEHNFEGLNPFVTIINFPPPDKHFNSRLMEFQLTNQEQFSQPFLFARQKIYIWPSSW